MPRSRLRGRSAAVTSSPPSRTARIRLQESGDELQQGRLAAAARADHGDQLARRDLEREVEMPAAAAGVAEADALERYRAVMRSEGDGPRRRERAARTPSRASASSTTVAAQAKPVAP